MIEPKKPPGKSHIPVRINFLEQANKARLQNKYAEARKAGVSEFEIRRITATMFDTNFEEGAEPPIRRLLNALQQEIDKRKR